MRYRVLIHGAMDAAEIGRLYRQFAAEQ
jgi:hypothetical protein